MELPRRPHLEGGIALHPGISCLSVLGCARRGDARKRGRGGIEKGSGRTGASRTARVCVRRDVGGSVLYEDRAPSGRDLSGARQRRLQLRRPARRVAQRAGRSSAAASGSHPRAARSSRCSRRDQVSDVPTTLDGVPVRTVVTGMIVARSATLRYPRPVPIGVSTGLADVATGTLGARVTNGANVYALSNNHVFAGVNAASIGDHDPPAWPHRGRRHRP